MPDPVVEEQPATRKAEAEQGCPVKMHEGRRCGRPIYPAPEGVDQQPVCPMHSHDPDKDDAAFQAEFERILREAGEGVADFTKFVFPTANYSGREFKPACVFSGATFTEDAVFFMAKFMQEVTLADATFTQSAVFLNATFAHVAHFRNATFRQFAQFGDVTFTGEANFLRSTFAQDAVFQGATFTQAAIFRLATFTQGADFRRAMFTGEADFRGTAFTLAGDFNEAKFEKATDFGSAAFKQTAHFRDTTFTGTANFRNAAFMQDVFLRATFGERADFSRAMFERAAYFNEAEFAREVDFRWVTFKDRAEFRETKFREDTSAEPGPMFSLARFEKPELVLFYKTYLGQAIFHNCDVSRLAFSAVRWRERSNTKRMVLEEDEKLDLTRDVTEALRTKESEPDERNYRLIEELYQQLKKNYDDRKDYRTAGDFHYGEVEMKRLATPQPNRLSRWIAGKIADWLGKEKPGSLACWAKRKSYSERSFHVLRRDWHRAVGLAAWYKYASEYGESYGRPVLCLVGTLIAFVLLYPWPGLRLSGKSSAPEPAASESRLTAKACTPELSYSNFFRYHSAEPGGARVTSWSLLRDSFMTTISVAAFQRDLTYEPTYPWGRLLAIVEILLTSTLLALFLLAVRRQFRR